ncbi:SDR family NAD(P)-dependent oxidoreductase [Candidatus Dojkabacteria bacterium]|nr:SDR family NAD(P)-dependent oxidoreductase [Candidatus Dojkabacteria bacterium]
MISSIYTLHSYIFQVKLNYYFLKPKFMKLEGKKILITGASSGIGAAFAERAAQDKCSIVLASRDITKLEKIAKKVEKSGSKAKIIQTDVTKENQVRELFLEAKKELGNIDLVFNNAGLGHIAKIHELTIEQIKQMIDVNVYGMIIVSKFAAEVMTRQKSGHIIMTDSLAGFITLPEWSVYVATKWAILGFADSIRQELDQHNIKVTTIHPGAVKTEFFDKDKANIDIQDAGEAITPEKVAEAVYKTSLTDKQHVLIPASTKMYAFLYKYAPAVVKYLIGRQTKKIEYHENLKEDEPQFDK